MRVYERRPSGLSVAELRAHAAREPVAARWAIARGVVGVVLLGCIALPLGLLAALVGAALVASTLLFARASAVAAIDRPSLVLRGRHKWDGVRRTNWSIEADAPLVVAERLAAELDEALGGPLHAFTGEDGDEGTTRRQVFAGGTDRAAIVAWTVRGAPRLAATGDADGVWIRVEPAAGDDEPPVIAVLANEGPATDALTQAAWRV